MGKSKKKSIILGCLVLTLVGGISYNLVSKSSKLEEPKQEKKGMLAMYVEDETGSFQLSNSKAFPKEGYILDHAECGRNDSEVTQDPKTKKISAKFSHGDSCNLYFAKEKIITIAYGLKANAPSITNYSDGNTGEMYTFDHSETAQTTGWSDADRRDYRYIGTNPNNWIRFNDEDWRIIGIFTVENENGDKEQLIKIIRNESIGNVAWNSSNINEWSSSSLKTLLNSGDYYNRANTYVTTGLNEKSRSQIEEVKWYLGGSSVAENLGGPNYYNFERSTNTTGKVGLMYPSDYAYTYANGVDYTCYTNGYSCNAKGQPGNGWLYNSSITQWTISRYAGNSQFGYNYVFIVDSYGTVNNLSNVSALFAVRPSVYLKSSIKIVSGDGASSKTAYVIE